MHHRWRVAAFTQQVSAQPAHSGRESVATHGQSPKSSDGIDLEGIIAEGWDTRIMRCVRRAYPHNIADRNVDCSCLGCVRGSDGVLLWKQEWVLREIYALGLSGLACISFNLCLASSKMKNGNADAILQGPRTAARHLAGEPFCKSYSLGILTK
jgi:hypothetical protein